MRTRAVRYPAPGKAPETRSYTSPGRETAAPACTSRRPAGRAPTTRRPLSLHWTDGEGFAVDDTPELDDDTLGEQFSRSSVRTPARAGRRSRRQRPARTPSVGEAFVPGYSQTGRSSTSSRTTVSMSRFGSARSAAQRISIEPMTPPFLICVPTRTQAGRRCVRWRGKRSASSASCVPTYKDAGRRDADFPALKLPSGRTREGTP